MDWNDASVAKKKLMSALMLGQMFHEARHGVLVTKDVKLMIGDDEFHYDGPEIRVKEGNIVEFGTTEEEVEKYEVISVSEKVVHLKKVEFFKAELITSHNSLYTVCVSAENRKSAMKVLREYCKENNYQRIRVVNPVSDIFEPLVR